MAATPVVVKQLFADLIVAVTGITAEKDPTNFKICNDYALRTIKNHTFMRTNPFEVNRKLDGLEERFSVVCKDQLADALRCRLDELKALDYKKSAEVLHLILELSWKPIENARLSDLEALKPPPPPKELTWEDIIAEEPLEGEIWDPIDFGDDSSELSSLEDDEMVDIVDEDDEMAKVTLRKKREMEEEEELRPVDCFTVPVDWGTLRQLKKAQYWYVPDKVVPEEADASLSVERVDDLWLVSELHAVRETLYMLGGVPCNLYEVGRRTLSTGKDSNLVWIDTHKLKKKFALRHASREGFTSLLGWFAERGTALNKVREFTKKKEDLPSRQAFAAAIMGTLGELNALLSRLQSTIVARDDEAQVISLLKLQQALETPLRPYITFSNIISTLPSAITASNCNSSSTHLDLLFSSACSMQSIGDFRSFQFLARIFFQCLQTYLRPIREWMESGELRAHDSAFFVSKTTSDEEVNLGSLWHDQFALIRDEKGNITAPRFVNKQVTNTIFVTGKSVVFLKRLINYERTPVPIVSTKPEIDWNTLFPQGQNVEDVLELAPFDELFALAFREWTKGKHHEVSTKLRNVLFENFGLMKALKAIDVVYMGTDGARILAFATAMFERMDKTMQSRSNGRGRRGGNEQKKSRSDGSWNDKFVLTELIQGIFAGEDTPIEPKRLSVRRVNISPPAASITLEIPSLPHYGSVKLLEAIELEYTLPWPLLNILPPERFSIFKRTFTFLLQLRRGKYVLEKLTLPPTLKGGKSKDEYDMLMVHLRHRLLWFVNVVFTYLTYHVLQPQMVRLEKDLTRAEDVDGMIDCVAEWTGRVDEMSLGGARFKALKEAIVDILEVAVAFGSVVSARDADGIGKSSYGRRSSKSEDDVEMGGVSLLPQPPEVLMPPPPLPPKIYRSRSAARRRRQRRAAAAAAAGRGGADSSYDDETDSSIQSFTVPDSDENTDDEEGKQLDYTKLMRALSEKFDSLLEFLRNGLKGLSRAGVLPHLELLAEGLEAGREGGWGGGAGMGQSVYALGGDY